MKEGTCNNCNKSKLIYLKDICKYCYKKEIEYKKHLKSPLIECACGCKQKLHCIDKKCRPVKYINGHQIGRGEKCRMWRGGRYKNLGYSFIYKPDYYKKSKQKYIQEHIYIYETYHKLCMLPWGDIHHINGIKDDNRMENLHGMMKRDHTILHLTKDTSNRICLICNSKTTYLRPDIKKYIWFKYNNGWICRKCYLQRKKMGTYKIKNE
jgi:HNH endonuclease